MTAYYFRKKAREALKGKWGLALGTGIVAALLGGTKGYDFQFNINMPDESSLMYSYSIMRFFGFATVIAFVSLAVSVIIGGVTEMGYKSFNLKLIRGENPQFENLFDYFKYIKKGVAMVLLRGALIFLQLLLFIVPGIIAIYRYALTPYILAENPDMPVMEAIELSKKMMVGNKMRLFGLQLSFIGWMFLATLSFGIGFLWLSPYMAAAKASFYENVKAELDGFNGFSGNTGNTTNSDFDHINWDE